MSFISDLLFGQPGEAARVEDIRTPEQIASQSQNLDILQQIINQGGLPQFSGETTAGLGDTERQLLDQLQRFIGGDFGDVDRARQSLGNIASGGTGAGTGVNPIFGEAANRPGQVSQGFDQIFDILTGATQDPNNPIVQNAITAATRPIIEQFEDASGVTRNAFTRAGQFVQPGSSSPFELAQSRLSTGLANALGDTGARIVQQNLTQERGRQSDLIGLLSNIFESGQQRNLQGQSQQLNAIGQTVPFNRGQIEGLGTALDTAALPRLIEQFGLTQGQNEFTRQQESLFRALQLAFGATAPQTVSIPGSTGSTGIIGPIAQGFGTAIGGPVGGAAGTAIANLFNRNSSP